MIDINKLLNLFLNNVKAVHRHLNLREADLHTMKLLGLVLQFVLHLLEVVKLGGHLRSLNFVFNLRFIWKLVHSLLDGLLVKVDQAHVFLEVFQLLIYSLFFHSEAIIVLKFDQRSLGHDLVD